MTGAEFVAAGFWPLVTLFALLLKFVRDPVLWRWIVRWAGMAGVLYFVLWFFYDQSSLVAVADFYLFLAAMGGGLIWFGCGSLYASAPDPKSKWQALGTILFGAALLLLPGITFIPDFTQPCIVLEGRVQSVRIQPGGYDSGGTEYLADIAGWTVKATTPVYERLKFLPVVRVEIGQGSRYIYKIEYLAN
jgi:hypothetical protein